MTIAAVLAPLALWCGYLWTLDLSMRETGERAFDWPMIGYTEEWVITIRQLFADGWQSEARFSLLSQVALTTRACWLVTRAQWDNLWWRIGLMYLALVVLLGSAGWEGDPGAITRVGLPVTFAFNLLLPASPRFWPLWLAGNIDIADGVRSMDVPLLSAPF